MSTTWKQRPEGGGLFAITLIRAIARHGGRWLARLLLYPTTLYFMLRRPPQLGRRRRWRALTTTGKKEETPRPISVDITSSSINLWRTSRSSIGFGPPGNE